MVNRISNGSADAYIQQLFSKMPDVEKGEAHVIQKGESLWVIAKNELGKNAKNKDINDYMLQLAKLNGLDTKDKMNNIRRNDTIYLVGDNKPKSDNVDKSVRTPVRRQATEVVSEDRKQYNVTSQADKKDEKAVTSGLPNYFELYKPDVWKPKSLTELYGDWMTSPKPSPVTANKSEQVSKPQPVQNVSPKPEVKSKPEVKPKPKNIGEAVFTDKLNIILNDKSVDIKKSDIHTLSGDQLYHMSKKEPFGSRGAIVQRALMSVTMDSKGKLKDISFEGNDNINPYGYDYEVKIDKKDNGTLYEKSYSSYLDKKCGAIDKSEIHLLQQRMDKVTKN